MAALELLLIAIIREGEDGDGRGGDKRGACRKSSQKLLPLQANESADMSEISRYLSRCLSSGSQTALSVLAALESLAVVAWLHEHGCQESCTTVNEWRIMVWEIMGDQSFPFVGAAFLCAKLPYASQGNGGWLLQFCHGCGEQHLPGGRILDGGLLAS